MVSEVGHGESVFGLADCIFDQGSERLRDPRAAWCLALAVAASSCAPKVSKTNTEARAYSNVVYIGASAKNTATSPCKRQRSWREGFRRISHPTISKSIFEAAPPKPI
jgi:hypothetical protein